MDFILYEYQTIRAGKHPAKFLEGFKGFLHVDFLSFTVEFTFAK